MGFGFRLFGSSSLLSSELSTSSGLGVRGRFVGLGFRLLGSSSSLDGSRRFFFFLSGFDDGSVSARGMGGSVVMSSSAFPLSTRYVYPSIERTNM